MATAKQYVTQLRNAKLAIGSKLGVDLTTAPKPDRVESLSVLALIGVLVKVLVDKGVVTNNELTTELNAAIADVWPDEPVEVTPPPPPP